MNIRLKNFIDFLMKNKTKTIIGTIIFISLAFNNLFIINAYKKTLIKNLGLNTMVLNELAYNALVEGGFNSKEYIDIMLKLDIEESRIHPLTLKYKEIMSEFTQAEPNIMYIFFKTKIDLDYVRYYSDRSIDGYEDVLDGSPFNIFYVFTSEDESTYDDRMRFDNCFPDTKIDYANKVPTISDILISPKWGTFIKTEVPIYDKDTNEVIGFLGVDYNAEAVRRNYTRFGYMIYSIFLAVTFICIFVLIYISKYLNKHNIIFNNSIKEAATITRMQRHDFSNHIQAIYGYLQINKIDEAKAYMKNIICDMQIQNTSQYLGDSVYSSFLYMKSTEASAKHVKLFINSTQESMDSIKIPLFAFVKIIGNLIDNAVQEVENNSNSDKYVKVDINSNDKGYEFIVTNPGSIKQIHKKMFKKSFTTKKSGNGFGLMIINETVKEYKGKIAIISYEPVSIQVSFTY